MPVLTVYQDENLPQCTSRPPLPLGSETSAAPNGATVGRRPLQPKDQDYAKNQGENSPEVAGGARYNAPKVLLDTKTISDAMAAALAMSFLGHVLFLKSQIPFPIMQLMKTPVGKANSKAAKKKGDFLTSYDVLSQHLIASFGALATALSKSHIHPELRPPSGPGLEGKENQVNEDGDYRGERAFLMFAFGPSVNAAKTKVVFVVDGLEVKVLKQAEETDSATWDNESEGEDEEDISDEESEIEDEVSDSSCDSGSSEDSATNDSATPPPLSPSPSPSRSRSSSPPIREQSILPSTSPSVDTSSKAFTTPQSVSRIFDAFSSPPAPARPFQVFLPQPAPTSIAGPVPKLENASPQAGFSAERSPQHSKTLSQTEEPRSSVSSPIHPQHSSASAAGSQFQPITELSVTPESSVRSPLQSKAIAHSGESANATCSSPQTQCVPRPQTGFLQPKLVPSTRPPLAPKYVSSSTSTTVSLSSQDETIKIRAAERLLSRTLANACAETEGWNKELAPTQTHILIRAPRRFDCNGWTPRQMWTSSLDTTLDEFLNDSGLPPASLSMIDTNKKARKVKALGTDGIFVGCRAPDKTEMLEGKAETDMDEDDEMIWWSWEGKLVGFSDW